MGPTVSKDTSITHNEIKWLQSIEPTRKQQLENRMNEADPSLQTFVSPCVNLNSYNEWVKKPHHLFVPYSTPRPKPKPSPSVSTPSVPISAITSVTPSFSNNPPSYQKQDSTHDVETNSIIDDDLLSAVIDIEKEENQSSIISISSDSNDQPATNKQAPSHEDDNIMISTANSKVVHFASSDKTVTNKGISKLEYKPFFVTYGDNEEIPSLTGILNKCPFNDLQLLHKNKDVFGHNAFRPGQLEVIKAALCGLSVFCIMPTGGGKSLCYQLPALMLPGVTVVISPLISLVQDQVKSLQEAGVSVGSVLGNTGDEVRTELWNSIRSRTVPRFKIIYTTPEKVNKSESMKNLLQALNNSGYLSLFVIDEVHCMSQWGHDFRPDYKELGFIRNSLFGNVPLMALTATATATVKQDILKLLYLPPKQVLVFQKSFNRPELQYMVKQKSGHKATIKDIATYIRTKHLNQTGIIYCGTQSMCEKVCKDLQEELKDIGYDKRIAFYHAGLQDTERERIQREWSDDTLKIIAATVAFGMGINKTDVRFVIHFQLPHSLTHYYQEAGRAGRDRKPAECILYFSYGDKSQIESLIRKSENQVMTHHNLQELYRVVAYCQNETDCRRVQILQYFSEDFDPKQCGYPSHILCDNCSNQTESVIVDMTPISQSIIQLISEIKCDLTANMVISAIRGLVGSINVNIRPLIEQHRCYGIGKQYTKPQLQQIVSELIYKDCLAEIHKVSARGFNVVYLTMGANANKILGGELKITISQRKKQAPPPPPQPNPKTLTNSIVETPFVEECEMEVTSRIPEEYCVKLYEGLIASRSMFATFFGSAAASVMTNTVMEEISRTVPTTEEELVTIDKMTPVFVKKFGASILNVVKEFLSNYHIELSKPFVSRGLIRKQQQKKLEEAMKKPEIIDIDDDLFKECDAIEKQMSQSAVLIPTRNSLPSSPPSSSHSKYFTPVRNENTQSPSPIKSSFVSILKNKKLSPSSSPFTSHTVSQTPLSLSQKGSVKRSFSDDDFSLFSEL